MAKRLKALGDQYKTLFTDRSFVVTFIGAVLLLSISIVLNFFAGIYATEKISNSVTDIILDNIPVFNLQWLFIYGPVILWIFVWLLCLWEPKKTPFIFKSIALFILIRAVFVTLTHIGPFPIRAPINYSLDIVKMFTSGGDLFFSAHTGLPFLLALMFWRNKLLRVIFIITSVFFGVIVLLAHLHYSIDVLAAFFITYTIFHLAEIGFKKDWQLFLS